jgi:hypothetical protein
MLYRKIDNINYDSLVKIYRKIDNITDLKIEAESIVNKAKSINNPIACECIKFLNIFLDACENYLFLSKNIKTVYNGFPVAKKETFNNKTFFYCPTYDNNRCSIIKDLPTNNDVPQIKMKNIYILDGYPPFTFDKNDFICDETIDRYIVTNSIAYARNITGEKAEELSYIWISCTSEKRKDIIKLYISFFEKEDCLKRLFV